MTFSRISTGIIFILCLASACERSDPPGIDPDEESAGATVTFLLESNMSLPTRAGAVSDDQIETLDILAFDASGATDHYLYSVGSVTVGETATDNIKKVTASVLKSSVPQRFVLIANAAQAVASLGDIPAGSSQSTILTPLTFSRTDPWSSDESDFVPVPMWGETVPAVIDDSGISLNATILRMASRLEICLSEDIDEKTFRLAGLHIYNANSCGYIVPSESNIIYDSGVSTHRVGAPTLPANPLTLSAPLSHSADAETGTLPWIYLFEAAAGSGSDDAPCIVVEGYYLQDQSPSYYRPDLASLDNAGIFEGYIPLLRNHRYIYTITGVETRGYATADEALAAGGTNLGFRLYIWDLGDIRDFVFDSNYVLGVSMPEIILTKDQATEQLLVTTDYPGGWKASVDNTQYGWLTIISAVSSTANAKDPLVFGVTENDTSTPRTGYIELTAGILTRTVTVYQED